MPHMPSHLCPCEVSRRPRPAVPVPRHSVRPVAFPLWHGRFSSHRSLRPLELAAGSGALAHGRAPSHSKMAALVHDDGHGKYVAAQPVASRRAACACAHRCNTCTPVAGWSGGSNGECSGGRSLPGLIVAEVLSLSPPVGSGERSVGRAPLAWAQGLQQRNSEPRGDSSLRLFLVAARPREVATRSASASSQPPSHAY